MGGPLPGVGWVIIVGAGILIFALVYVVYSMYQLSSSQILNSWDQTADRLERTLEEAERERRAWMRYAWLLADMLRAHCLDCVLPPPPIGNGHGVTTQTDAAALTPARRQKLREVLGERLSQDELRDIAFDLGFSVDGFNSTAELARRLVEYVDHKRQADYLTARLKSKRPDISL